MKEKMRTPLVKNSLNPSPLRRHVLFVVSAIALVAPGVALQPLAYAGAPAIPTDTPPAQFQLLATVALNTNARGSITVNEALNKIYVGGNPSDNFDIEVNAIDGVSFTIKDVGYGDGTSVDVRSNRYWSTTIYQDNVIVRDGVTDAVVTTIPIPGGVCPIQSNYDFFKKRMWISAQCGAFNDPIFAIDAKTFAITAGPIGSGGVMAGIIANGANGRLYFSDQDGGVGNYISKRVDPTTFAVTVNAFGIVRAINGVTNKLYAVPCCMNQLQIIDGKPDPEVILKTVSLSYLPASLGINTALNHLYLANPVAQSIEVRDPSKGTLLATFSLASLGLTPDGPMAVDSIRGRIYVIQYTPVATLLVIEDLLSAVGPNCILSH